MRPLLSCVPEVTYHLSPVVVLFCKNSPQILERGDLGDGESIFSELLFRPLPCLLFRQAMPLPLQSPSAEGSCKVPASKGLLWHKHVALRTPGLGEVALLQDHNCIPHVAVFKVNTEVGLTRRPPPRHPATRHWSRDKYFVKYAR